MSDPVYPQWRKVLLSGSNAYVHALTASGLDLSPGDPATEKVLVVGTGGAIYYTGSYGSGGGGGTATNINIGGAVGEKYLTLNEGTSPSVLTYDTAFKYNATTNLLTVGGDVSATWVSASSGIQHSSSDTKITLSDNLINLSALGSGDPFTVTIQGDTGGGDTATLLITASDTSQAILHLKSLRPQIWFEEYGGSPDFYLYQKSNGLHLGTNAIVDETITFYPSLGSISGSGDLEINNITSSGYVTVTEGITSNGEVLINSSSNGDFEALTIKNSQSGVTTPSVSLKFKQGGGNGGRISSERDGIFTTVGNSTAGLHFYTVFENVETASLILSSSGLVSIPGFISSSGTSDNLFGGRLVLDNAKYFVGTQTDNTTRNLLGIDASDIIQIGNANIPTNIKGSSITITNALTASIVSASSNMYASTADAAGASYNTLMVDIATGKFYHTGSYGGGGGTPGGSNTQVQFNQLGSFGGDDAFTFISSSNVLQLGNATSTYGALAIYGDTTSNQTVVLGGNTGEYFLAPNNILIGAQPAAAIPQKLTIEGGISASGNIYIQSGSAAYTDIVYSSQFTTASYLYFEDDLNPEQSANNTTLASIAGINFIMDTNNNDVHQFYWSYGGLTPATSTPIMTLNRSGQLSGSSLSFIGKTGNFSVDVTSPIISASTELGTDADIYAPNLPAGVDNSVVIQDSDGYLKTDEIDSRVWGSTLIDASGTPSTSWIPRFSDTNTVTSDNTLAFVDGTLRIGGKAGVEDTHVLYMPPILGSTTTTYKSGIEVNASDFNAEGQSTGEIFNAINGASLTRTEIVYYGKAGAWAAANATTVAPASGMLGLVINTGPSQTAALTKGYMVVAGSQIGGTYNTGSALYLGTSSGMFQAFAPGNVGHTIRKVGWVVNGGLGKTGTDVLVHFNPSSDFITN